MLKCKNTFNRRQYTFGERKNATKCRQRNNSLEENDIFTEKKISPRTSLPLSVIITCSK